MFCSLELLIALKAWCCGRSRMSCVQVAGAASTRGPGVMDSAAFLLMAFDCGCQPGPWHCILAGSVRFVSRAGADSCPWGGLGWVGKPIPALLPPFPAVWAGLASTRHVCGTRQELLVCGAFSPWGRWSLWCGWHTLCVTQTRLGPQPPCLSQWG